MNTPKFWHTVDRLGTSGAALCVWRLELGDEFAAAMPYLGRLTEFADYIPAPGDRRQRLKLYPRADGTWSAQSDDFPACHDSLVVTADDVTCFAPDWDALRPALAASLGFVPGLFRSASDVDTRQIGIVQLPKSPTQPVFLHLPRGGFSDYARFVHAIQSLPAGILYVPSAQWLETDICHLARRHDLRIEPLAERFAIPELARPTPLSISGVARGSKGRQAKPTGLAAILNVKADWRWDRVIVRLTDAGTLIASHGEETGQHVFARNTGSGIRNYPQFFRTMLELSYHQQWINPHRGDPDYESRRQAFKRLREQLIQLIPIPEQPFRRRGGAWEPKFKVELDGALDSACRTWFPRSNERLRSTSIRQTGARQRVATSLSKDDASSYDEDESEPSDV